MRRGIVCGAALLVGVLAGCSSPKPRSQSAEDVFVTMRAELARSFAQVDAFEAMDDELAHAIGTTTVTSATLPRAEPDVPEEKPLQTWGYSEPAADDADDAPETQD